MCSYIVCMADDEESLMMKFWWKAWNGKRWNFVRQTENLSYDGTRCNGVSLHFQGACRGSFRSERWLGTEFEERRRTCVWYFTQVVTQVLMHCNILRWCKNKLEALIASSTHARQDLCTWHGLLSSMEFQLDGDGREGEMSRINHERMYPCSLCKTRTECDLKDNLWPWIPGCWEKIDAFIDSDGLLRKMTIRLEWM